MSNAQSPNGAIANGWTDFSADPEPSVPSDCITEDAEPAPSASNATATFTSSASLSPNAEPNSDPSSERSCDLSADSWRVEVAARLERYRTRRKPRSPRYPSLLLPFDAPESWSRSAPTPLDPVAATLGSASQNFASQTNLARNPELYLRDGDAAPAIEYERNAGQDRESSPEPSHELCSQVPSSNLIEFPRSAAIPIFHASDLADPVFDYSRPRILEAPEILPAPPALGGMLIEPSLQELADKRAHLIATFPSTSAPIRQRVLAALVDGTILTTALSAFAAIFLRLNPSSRPTLHPGLTLLRTSLPLLIGAISSIAALFWMAYEFVFVVYTGSTPGLRAARLRLAAFDGCPLNRSARRWRVFASFLSAFSAGLGYLWCLIDQHGLCWHDRITRTHVQRTEPENVPAKIDCA
jgi:uncharacterized RDD family membrane protein YckC